MSAANFSDENYFQNSFELDPIVENPEYLKCTNCPLQLYVIEEAQLSRDRNDEASGRAWETFGKNVLHNCRQEAAEVSTRKRFYFFGEQQIVVRCSSPSSKQHRSKFKKMILPALLPEESSEDI